MRHPERNLAQRGWHSMSEKGSRILMGLTRTSLEPTLVDWKYVTSAPQVR